jgi:hypothetical protein
VKANLHAAGLALLAMGALIAAALVGMLPRGERYPDVKDLRPCRALIDGSPFAFCGRLADGTLVVTNKWRRP